jgi:hypothetical protein
MKESFLAWSNTGAGCLVIFFGIVILTTWEKSIEFGISQLVIGAIQAGLGITSLITNRKH